MQLSYRVLIVAASLGGTAAFAATPPVVARDLAQAIHEKGAANAASSLGEKQFDYVVDQAAKGRPEWLRLSADLIPGTDGARSEGIELAFSSALQTNPLIVLQLIQADPSFLQIARLCEDRAIEPADAHVRAYHVRATRALQTVTDPSLRQLRDTCLATLSSKSAS